MAVKRRLTPAEKKRLSYDRDTRNSYGENDKSSRRNIPLRKRLRARQDRRRASATVSPASLPDEIVDGDDLEVKLLPRRDPRQWQKAPDRPLKDHVAKVMKQRGRRERPDDDR
jgi:hypothetical protein